MLLSYGMAPKRIIDTADIDPKQRQRNAKQIISQEAIVMLLAATAKNVVKGRQDHAHLKAALKYRH